MTLTYISKRRAIKKHDYFKLLRRFNVILDVIFCQPST
jgi:hypothetical protein